MADEVNSTFPLGRDIAACLFNSSGWESPFDPALSDQMYWLLRYANHCKVLLDPSRPPGHAVKRFFSPAAWRLVYRTGRKGFLPILKNPLLNFHDLARYAETLVKAGWQRAPEPRHLALLIRQKYEFFDSAAAIPVERSDLILLRVAGRQPHVSERDFMLITRWVTHSGKSLAGAEQWQGLLRKAKTWTARQKAHEEAVKTAPWYFYCAEVNWRGYQIVPLRDGLDLWEEGQAMSHCVYDIRGCCDIKEPSRFFSVRVAGKRVATLELEHQLPDQFVKGTDRLFGRWCLRDLRRSANRPMPTDEVKHFKVFAWQYNLWSQRPGRQPGGHLKNQVKVLSPGRYLFDANRANETR